MKTTEAIKIKFANLVDELEAEADRFTQLAKDAALKSITSAPGDEPWTKQTADQRRKALDHLLRAETFREAAAIANRKSQI